MRASLSPCIPHLPRSFGTINPHMLKASRVFHNQTFTNPITCLRRGLQTPLIRTDQRLLHSMAASDRANTVGFIGLGAMGNHMVLASTKILPDTDTDAIFTMKINNLISRTIESGKPRYNFAVFDVNGESMDRVIEHHRFKNGETKLMKCSCT